MTRHLIGACALCAVACAPPPSSPALLLARHPEQVSALSLPPSGRSTPTEGPRPLSGPFQRIPASDASPCERHAARLPFLLENRFNNQQAPPGLHVDFGSSPLPYAPSDCTGGWRLHGNWLVVDSQPDRPPPDAGAIRLTYPPAVTREQSLHLETSGLEPLAFALGARVVATAGGVGVLLPAPAEIRWTVDIPPGAILSFDARILPAPLPEGGGSDGADLVIEAERPDGHLVRRVRHLGPDQPWVRVDLPLSRAASTGATLQLTSRPSGTATQDLVFVRDPAIYVPDPEPEQVILVLADTLRRDRLGVYNDAGHATSPGIDAWARHATVFDDARSVAPWTLPAVRSILTGWDPERAPQQPGLAARLAAAGFATAALVGNAFLTPEYGIGADFGTYDLDLMAPADAQIDAARAYLARHADRDALVLVHFMDTHLPWQEPEPFRTRWAGPAPDPILAKPFSRTQLSQLDLRGRRPAIRSWLNDRYDQTVAWLDHNLGPFLADLSPRNHVVLVSDHGEELLDHGGLEHGHALWDELIRVPLIVASPALPPGRVALPASVQDVAGLILELVGLSRADLPGPPWLSAVTSGGRAAQMLTDRPRAFGRTLRGHEAWGVERHGVKWTTTAGAHRLVDLQRDPDERSGRAQPNGPVVSGRAQWLADALDRPVVAAVRVVGPGVDKVRGESGRIIVSIPGGFSRVWPATGTPLAAPVLVGGTAVLTPGEDGLVTREFWALPRDAGPTLSGLSVRWETPTGVYEAHRPADAPFIDGIALAVGPPDAPLQLAWDWAPVPPADWQAHDLRGAAEAPTDALRALGYIDGE